MAGKPRKRSFGTVRTLPSGRVQARYTGPDMRRYTAPLTFRTAADAQSWLDVTHSRIVMGTWEPPRHAGVHQLESLTVADFASGWLARRDLKPRTADHYRHLVRR